LSKFYLVPKLCFGTEAIEAPLQNYVNGSRASDRNVPKWNLGTRNHPSKSIAYYLRIWYFDAGDIPNFIKGLFIQRHKTHN
jgi:hypothetical protein